MEDRLRLSIRQVPLQWHEAVAIVRDVADWLAEGKIREVPASDSLAVDAQGIVHLLRSESTIIQTRHADATKQIAELRHLLGELLPAEAAPQELVRLASGEVSGPAPANAAEFSQTLAFFERPSRQKDLQGLAARLSEAHDRHKLDEELESLTRKARTEGQPPNGPLASHAERHRKHVGVRLVFGVGCIVVVLLLSAFLLTRLGNPPAAESPVSLTAASATREDQGFLARVSQTARSFFGNSISSEPSARPAVPRPDGEPRTAVTKASGAAITPSPPRGQLASAPVDVPPQSVWDAEHVAVALSDAPPAASRENVETVYDNEDREVMPAALVRPYLPSLSQPDAERKARSVLAVLVDDRGRVEQVRILRTTPERRYYDAMLLPAVKAWVFKPATRNGQPVRYRLLIPLT